MTPKEILLPTPLQHHPFFEVVADKLYRFSVFCVCLGPSSASLLVREGGGHQDQVGGLLGGVKICRTAAKLPLQVGTWTMNACRLRYSGLCRECVCFFHFRHNAFFLCFFRSHHVRDNDGLDTVQQSSNDLACSVFIARQRKVSNGMADFPPLLSHSLSLSIFLSLHDRCLWSSHAAISFNQSPQRKLPPLCPQVSPDFAQALLLLVAMPSRCLPRFPPAFCFSTTPGVVRKHSPRSVFRRDVERTPGPCLHGQAAASKVRRSRGHSYSYGRFVFDYPGSHARDCCCW